jgi:hypothetical protein
MITLNNTNYEFKFSFRAIKEIEKKRGKKLTEIFKELENTEEGIDFDLIVDLGYFGMLFTSTPKTIEEVEEILDAGTKKDIEEILVKFSAEVLKFMEVDPNAKSQTS